MARNTVKDRLRRLRRLRQLGAPKWIIKYEQVVLLEERYGIRKTEELIERHVRKIMGQGSITIPDGDGE
jgi:hypothetical protein